MDDSSAKQSASLEKLVIRIIENVDDLKAKLLEIITAGKNYEYDVSSCLKELLKSSDESVVLMAVRAISELAKCEKKRETYAKQEFVDSILSILNREVTSENVDLFIQSCRALGNLCCDCDATRKVMLEKNAVQILRKILKTCFDETTTSIHELKVLSMKTMLNYAIGGQEFSGSLIKEGIIEDLGKVLIQSHERQKMDFHAVTTALLLLSVVNDNDPEYVFDEEINKAVLNILKITRNVQISEFCLEHLQTQAEYDTVKTQIAKDNGINLVCVRIEELLEKHEAGELAVDDASVETLMKQACDFIIIVLTGDEAMNILYNNGVGEVYMTMVKWMDSKNYQLLATAVLAIGNFARRDDYCTQMMENKIYDKLLDIFEVYHNFNVRMQTNPDEIHPIDKSTVIKIQHASLSAIRNLTVPPANKRIAAAQGRAAPLLINALPNVTDYQVAYKLLAALRMLVDGQEGVARRVTSSRGALAAAARWGRAEHAGAAGEAPRLLAWTVRLLPADPALDHVVQVEGCISSLVNMLLASHSLMQNEAILSLTLISIHILKNTPDNTEMETNYATQLIQSEIGKHVSVLIETNCAKMPLEVAENLIAFLDITSKNNIIVSDYKESKVHESLKKFVEARKNFSAELKLCIENVISIISGK